MGNLICCAGENHNKRGGTNVKTLLRKTEKPGKRRRIDDLVRDVLRKEQIEDRQNRKREKKQTNQLSQEHDISTGVDVKEPSEVQNEKKEGVASADEVEYNIEGSLNEATSRTSIGEEECVDEEKSQDSDQSDLSSSPVKDANTFASEQPHGCTDVLTLYPNADVGIKSDSVDGPIRVTDDPTKESMPAKKDETEGREVGTHETECGVTNGSDVTVTNDEQVPEEDSERKTQDTDTTNVDDETEHISRINAEGDESGISVIQMEMSGSRDDIDVDGNKNPNEYSDNENELDTETSHSDESTIIDESHEQNIDKRLSEQAVQNYDEVAEDVIDSSEIGTEDQLSELSDESEVDLYEVCEGLRADAATDDSGDISNEWGLQDEEISNDAFVQTRNQDGTRFAEGEKLNGDNKAEDIIGVHDTENRFRSDEDVNMTHNDDSPDTVDVLKVHDTDNLPETDDVKTTNEDNTVDILKVHETDSKHGYDNTELRRSMEEDRALLCENTALEQISRSNQMGLKQWGSLIDLRDVKKFSFASMLKVVDVYKKQMIHKLRPVNTLSKARAIGYSSTKKNLTNKSTTKYMYGVRNFIMNGGQKPQIKAIERLKKDTYNFPPKFRQFTEEDKHGSLADLKWSRHMRAEARRHIGMESFEFEELKFLTNVASTNDDEFDVCDVPRASKPVPGTRPQNYQKTIKTTKLNDKLMKLRDRYGTDGTMSRSNTPTRLGTCTRPGTSINRYMSTRERKEAAFQNIARQFEKSFKKVEFQKSKDNNGHLRNNTRAGIGRQTSHTNLGEVKGTSRENTKCVGIGRQKSFMDFGDDNERREN